MIISYYEWFTLFQGAAFYDSVVWPNLKQVDWLYESYSFADDGAHYIRTQPEYPAVRCH